MSIAPIILCGGSGTRLWPLSRKAYPKQFMPLVGDKTMLQDTILRLPDLGCAAAIVISNQEHRFLAAQQLEEIGAKAEIVLEPEGRNTAPAIAAGALLALKSDKNAILLVMPSDHIISDVPAFHDAVEAAIPAARKGALVTFGITPDYPATGYGYIEKGGAFDKTGRIFRVKQFREKPGQKEAMEFIGAGGFYWNSGIFLFTARHYLEELEAHQPEILKAVKKAVSKAKRDLDFLRLDEAAFKASPSQSIDYGIMEKTAKAAVVPVSMGWSDVGSWSVLLDLGEEDKDGNVVRGEVVMMETKKCYIRSDKGLVGTLGIKDLVIVNMDDALLVAHRDKVQDIKGMVDLMAAQNRPEIDIHPKVYRPWGNYQTIDFGPRFKVKNIEVKPGARLSLQMHHHRAEHWVVVEGTAKVTRGEEVILLEENQSTYIPIGTKHRLENPGKLPLHIIEIQSGAYLEEDDIVRFDDVYGRTSKPPGKKSG
ncbi:MAG: mannose-1-phosphate guanylyltransferase/mannose-6-phosphate isomerase [Proteobacteria bacterium]|nr:mannose-1-phosphate guanylyltransferase/mannose-6-phosphate isomerase [Pseudomonadota bacterium]